jgi:acyl dehydratase
MTNLQEAEVVRHNPDVDPEPHSFVLPIEKVLTRRFAYAATDENPIYFDDEAARAAGYERTIAPPTFVASMLDYTDCPPESMLKEDGVATGLFPTVVKDDALLMGGGQDIEFLAPVYQGDEVTMTRNVVDHYKRPSKRFGELDFIVMVSEGVNQDGVTVVRITDTLIAKQD